MPLDFAFHRAIAERQLQAITNHQPVSHSGKGWSYQELLQLSATAALTAFACGPPELKMQPGELNKLTRREQVRLFRQHRRENAAVQKLFVEMTDRLVVDPEEYESMYEPIVVGTATLDNEMQLRVVELCEPNGHGGHHAEVRQMSSEPAQVDIAITHGRNSDVDVPASLPVVVLP